MESPPPSHPGLRALASCTLAAAVWWWTPGDAALRAGLAIFALVGGLWTTQALPLALTALTVPLLATLSGVMPARQALAPFANPVIFLFLGGFALAAALAAQGIDRALAGAVLRLARGRPMLAIILLSGLSALLSMWMSNTATVALMVPLALGLLTMRGAGAQPPSGPTQVFALLALAYGASIGGMATLVGSPPNAIAAAQSGISFTGWLARGLPLALVLWPLMLGVLALALRPSLPGRFEADTEVFTWTRPRMAAAGIFALTVLGWTAGAPLAHRLGINADTDTLVSLAAIVALVASGTLDWRTLEQRTQWSVLLLFGGGLSLGEVMSASGAGRFLSEAIVAWAQGMPPWLLMLAVVAFVVFLTELVSNTASAALLLPLLMPVAAQAGLSGPALAAATGLAASCAFMLPVATPPNALVFGTGRVPAASMMRCGFLLNLVAIAIIGGAAAWVWR